MAQKPMVGKGEHGAPGWVVPTLLPVYRTSALRVVKATAWWLEGAARLPPELRRTYDFSKESFQFSRRRSDRGMGPNGISASVSSAVVGFEHMKCFGLAQMFSGLINRRLVISCHPFLVVCAKGIMGEFSSQEGAERFLSGRGYGAGCIYRHNGCDWDKLEKNPWAVDRVEFVESSEHLEDS